MAYDCRFQYLIFEVREKTFVDINGLVDNNTDIYIQETKSTWNFTWLTFLVFLRVWDYNSKQWTTWLIISYLSSVPVDCKSFWSSPRIVNEFRITFRQMDIVALFLNLQRCPVRGIFLVRPYWFHVQMLTLILLIKILSDKHSV